MSDTDLDADTAATTRRLAGSGATVGTAPDEISIELRAGRPSYIHVAEGHLVYEGDAAHRDHLGAAAPTVRTWTVETITPDRVVGRDRAIDEPTGWDRGTLEHGLAVGTYSTNLTDFERLSVHEVGGRDGAHAGDGASPFRYTGQPYVAVVAYGDNGLKYGRRYRFVEESPPTLALWTQDEPVEHLAATVAERLDQRVREALEADGYAVAE